MPERDQPGIASRDVPGERQSREQERQNGDVTKIRRQADQEQSNAYEQQHDLKCGYASALRQQGETGADRGLRGVGHRHSDVHADIGRTLLAKQSVRPEDHHQKEENKEEHLSERGRNVVAAQRLHHADADPAQEGAADAAHATEDDNDEGNQHEVEADGGEDREQRHHRAGGKPDKSGAAGESEQEDTRHRNAHEHCGLAVLDCRADRLAQIRCLDHPLETKRASNGDGEPDEQLDLDIEGAERERLGEQGRDVEEVGAHQHQSDVLQKNRQTHGDEHHDEMGFIQRGLDQQRMDDPAEQEHRRDDRQRCDVGIEPEELGHCPCPVHRDHQEFAVREVDDT